MKKQSILKDTPDYEKYTENEAVLTVDESRELMPQKCGGCCKNTGCSSKKGCCKNRNI